MTWQNPNLWKKKTKDWCRVFWILKTQKEPLGVFRTRICIVNAGGSSVAAYAKNIHQLHQPFFSHGPSNSTRVKHSYSSVVPTLSTPSVFSDHQGPGTPRATTDTERKESQRPPWNATSQGERSKERLPWRGNDNNNGFRVAMSWAAQLQSHIF